VAEPLYNLFDGDPPTSLRDLIDRFTTDGVTSTPFDGGTQHSGTLKSLRTDPIALGFGELEIPGITAGTPFRLALFDAPVGRFHLDIVLDGVSLKLRDLHGADFIREAGTTPRRLIRKATDTAVVIAGEATIRFQRASENEPEVVLFVDNSSAVDPLANSGAVVRLRCNPPHFFFGTSEFGMTLTELLFDASDSFSPQFIQNAGQPAKWMGFAIAEATFYAPPNALGRGGFSGGVRNLLIGAPRGVQGELELQWGRAPLDPSTFVFSQDGTTIGASGSGNARLVALTATSDDSVAIDASFVASNPPEGGTVTDWSAIWRWPDGSETQGDAATGTVGHGQVLRVTPQEVIAGRPIVRHPEVSFRFVASGEIPEIDVITAGTSIVNAVHIAGPAAGIAGVFFRARSNAPTPGTFKWTFDDQPEQVGISVQLPVGNLNGDRWLVLTEELAGETRKARIRVQVIEGVALLVGGEDGIADVTDPPVKLTPASVEGSYDLPDFHAQGQYRPAPDAAVVDATLPERVDVPDGTLAIVTIASGGAAPIVEHDRHVAIEFEFATGVALRWAAANRPVAVAAGGSETDLHRQLLTWANNYPGATFLVVGRCDDIGDDIVNAKLAKKRNATVLSFLKSVPGGSALTSIDLSRITAWGEQDGLPVAVATTLLDDEEKDAQRLINATDVNGIALTNQTGWPDGYDTAHACEDIRKTFRRVDIYAVDGTPTAGAIRETLSPGRAPNLRRMMMSGEPVDPVPAPTSTPASDYRVKLLIGWDRPTGDGWKDLIPSIAEFEFAWSPDDHPLPTLGGDPVTMEVLTVYGGWRHDDATGFTRTQLGIRSDGDPEGLFKSEQANLVAALALGPVLLSGVDSTTDTIEKAGRIAALAAAAAFAKVDLGGGPLVGPGSKAIFKSLEANAQVGDIAAPGEGYKVKLVSDYSTVLHVNTGRLGLRTEADNPVKFRYKKVGIEFDSTKTDFWDKVGVAYPTDALEIEDPGKWKIEGALGKLLRAVETAVGTGSVWVETRFAFALTIGVVEISEAIIRVTFKDGPPGSLPDFSLRGLVARIDIPSTIKGEGRLRIEDPGGVIKAGIDLEIIPLKIKASAAFAMASITNPEPFTFINLFAKVQFPVGIPLANSGAAIYGFSGQTVINGTRDVVASTDVVKREIGWWMKNPEDKYAPLNRQHALGFGAVVGTLPDASFSLSAMGMIVVAFPDVEVIFGVEVNLLQIPDKTAKEKGGNQNATIIGLIVINDEAVSLAVSARYEIPKILKLAVPFSAYFPYSGDGVYVRIGSDNHPNRPGEAITLTLLPDTLNVKAFSYLMIEQAGLPSLGGRPEFSFDGFSIGFGAGASLEWRAGPFKLSASVLLLAGFGTDPLLIKAGIFVKGELNLVVVSVAASGEIVLTYQNGSLWLDGKFCGRVDFFFFSVSGCVKFRIGNPSALAIAAPPSPIASINLVDNSGRIMGQARTGAGALAAEPLFRMAVIGGETRNTGVDPKDNHTVWADTAPVINFRHFIEDAIPDGRQFNPTEQPSGERWFGSNRMKYSYRLDDVRLVRASDGVAVSGPSGLKSVWVHTPARQPGSGGPLLPSGAEVQSLMLLDWKPWLWALPMADGGASQPGDPATTIRNLCDPIPDAKPACLFGRDARGAGIDRIRLLHETPPPGPYPSRFTLIGRPVLRVGNNLIDGTALTAIVATLGGVVVPGAVVNLTQPVAGPSGPLSQGYRLPAMQIALTVGVRTSALPWRAEFDRTIRRGRLLLLVCDGDARRDDAPPHDCFSFEGVPIGRTHSSLQVPGYLLSAAARSKFTVADDVALAQGGAISGADRNADIRIQAPGLTIKPDAPAAAIELHFFRNSGQAIAVNWIDDAGKKYKVTEPAGQNGAIVIALAADSLIVEIKIAIKADMVSLFRICTFGMPKTQRCFDFSKLPESQIGRGSFSYEGVSFASVDPGRRLELIDLVDTRPTPPVRGNDGKPELLFPDKGVELKPDTPWSTVSVGVLSGGGPVTAMAFDIAGNLVARAQDAARDPIMLELAAPGVARIIVSGGDNEAAIYRICHGTATAHDCADFSKVRPQETERLRHAGIVFAAIADSERIIIADRITDSADGQVDPQQDGRPELFIPEQGMTLTPEAPLSEIKLYVATLGGERAEAVAFDADGNRIAAAQGGDDNDSISELLLGGDGIVRVELKAGGKSFLTRFCTASVPGKGRVARPKGGVPVVTTRIGQSVHDWTPNPIGNSVGLNGTRCRLIRYDQPAEVRDANNFEINTPTAHKVTLLSVCAVDSVADDAREQDQAAQAGLSAEVTEAAGGSLDVIARAILLDPGQSYRIEVDWSWRGWVSNEDGTDSPPGSPEPAWQNGGTDSYRFRIASEDLAIGETQDGLNEYKFDPRDIARYLTRTEPADGRDVVFTDDPLWVHFNSGHVEALVDRYGRELVLAVRRTDPPPQPDAAAMELAVFPDMVEVIKAISPASTLTVTEQRINDAVIAAPCLPGGPVVGGTSIGTRFKLEKHSMYDFNLIARKKGVANPALADPVVVNATRFITSRYANPAGMLAALGFPTTSRSPFPPQEIILADGMVLPTGPMSVSDRDMEAALAAIGADTLPLPGDDARVIALWRLLPGGTLGVAGILVDAPEPMRREAAILQGQQAVDSVRCEPERLSIAGLHFLPVRATLNWTRVLFVPIKPVTPVNEDAMQFRFKTGRSATLTGERTINARPVMFETEGF
jgi:hypothetical protein